ncbi:cation/H(+) antiporter 15-like [Tasmannia lanceolata]|uniref:cation/H(+) antiporter 15-like n=1 Tax=Tasmannia lanceolata TaxID=3420 RepID=UPI0040649D56
MVQKWATCTVGILVDRGLGGAAQVSAPQSMYHMAVLFFGGPDDREALAYGGRIVDHPGVSLSLIRFLPKTKDDYDAGVTMDSYRDDQVMMVIRSHEDEKDADEAFLSHFYNRYVVTGLVTYVERFVDNGPETVTALSAMESLYSFFIIGKGAQGLSPLTTGMSDWEEHPELGPIGDLLASSDFSATGSVLVLKQHRESSNGQIEDEFAVPS